MLDSEEGVIKTAQENNLNIDDTHISILFVDGNNFPEYIKKRLSSILLEWPLNIKLWIAIFKELGLRRKKKLLELAFVSAETGISKRDFENLMPFEKETFERKN